MAAYDEVRRLDSASHTVTITEKERITITAVQDVDSFNENEIIFLTALGMITVLGDDLHIARLDLSEGVLVIDGMIQTLDYSDHEELRAGGKPGLFGKLFK